MEDSQGIRTLLEIIDDAKGGNMPSHEECYYAMLAYDAMFLMDHNKLLNEFTREKPRQGPLRRALAENSFKMYQGALAKSPKEWLGPNHDPMAPECQQRRKVSLAIWDKFQAQRGTSHD